MTSKGRSSLQSSLDKEVFQVVRKYQDDQSNESSSPPSVAVIYRYIQSSNSTLKRKPKQLLNGSIERVLAVLTEAKEGSDESQENIDIDVDMDDLNGNVMPSRSANFMNKSITGAWATGSSGTATPLPANGTNGRLLQTLTLVVRSQMLTIMNEGSVTPATESKKRQANGEPMKKKRKAEDRSPPTSVTLEDIGGVDNVIQQLGDALIMPLLMPEEYTRRRLSPPRGILLHGPPGCGKTVISRAFAAKIDVPFVQIQGPSIVSGMSGESEQKVRDLFDEARRLAPCLLFIDEIDVIAPKRDSSQSQMEKRIVAQMLLSMDSLAMDQNEGKPVIVLAATNRPDSLDPALRRGGRFDTEINMGVPNEIMREQILKALTRLTPVSPDVDFSLLAKRTPGFVGADLRDLVDKAGAWSMDQFRSALRRQAAELTDVGTDLAANASQAVQLVNLLIKRAKDKNAPRPSGFEEGNLSMQAFMEVLPKIQPSSKREGFATIPDTTWSDIGALQDVREALEMAVVQPIEHPQRYKNVGISAPTGVLLFGPPGCGKTLLAKAVARESKANFISVKGPELLNKYVGESERAVRQVFTRARSSVPCVLFFDELDALVPKRDDSLSEASSRVVNTLLTELDGLSGSRDGIYIIAATNRPDTIDAAMLRPGRLETLCFVGLPGPNERVEILAALLKKTPINVELAACAQDPSCNGYTGADLSSLIRTAGQNAIRRRADQVERVDFEAAITQVRRSVSDKDMLKYEKMRLQYQSKL